MRSKTRYRVRVSFKSSEEERVKIVSRITADLINFELAVFWGSA
ncbi:MAG: hypothetical protein PUF72_07245 [Clostridiales bacterium]|nr:hypothetical protein [Clostridiales bacterium]